VNDEFIHFAILSEWDIHNNTFQKPRIIEVFSSIGTFLSLSEKDLFMRVSIYFGSGFNGNFSIVDIRL